jgi:DNA-binding response OmpR family regulator
MNVGLGRRRRTILLVDADPHGRAILRKALEAAGFSVGEAANDHEAERTALRIQPDAILAEVTNDTAADGSIVAERLKALGSKVPCFIISTASDALIGSTSLHNLGISGVFMKPVDTDIVIRSLQARFNLGAAAHIKEGGHA